VLVRRIPGTKTMTHLADLVAMVTRALDADQQLLYAQALARREDSTVEVRSVDDAAAAAATGWARIDWSILGPKGEAALADQGVSVRCLLRADGEIPDSDDEPGLVAVVGRSY